MKNLLFLWAFALCAPLFAQPEKTDQTSPSKQKFSLEMMAGANLNNMTIRPNFIVDNKNYNDRLLADFTFFAGLTGRQSISDRLSVRLDVQYLEKGYGVDQGETVPNSLERYRATYIDFVPQVEYKAYKNLYFSLGGYGGILLDERIKYVSEGWTGIHPDFGPLAEKADFGLSTGLRMVFGRFSALVKYQHGLTSAFTFEATDITGASSTYRQFQRSLLFGLGFRVL